MDNYNIVTFTIDMYDKMLEAWKETPGIGLSGADSREGIAQFLRRNPDGGYAAVNSDGKIVGGVLAGHDGRRGYIYHLFVQPQQRKKGIGALLMKRVIDYLTSEGIEKSHLFVFSKNQSGRDFWEHAGWDDRKDIEVFSLNHPAQNDGNDQ